MLVPAQGVYAGAYKIGEAVGPAALSAGPAPTFPEKPGGDNSPGPQAAFEGHLLDMDGDLYGQLVTIAFTHRLRDQQPFPDAKALSEQIARDVLQVRELFHIDALAEVPY